jgi:DNA-directed RNA polymerase subunit RPC12/RpoP
MASNPQIVSSEGLTGTAFQTPPQPNTYNTNNTTTPHSSTTTTSSSTPTQLSNLQPQPEPITCPNCGVQTHTRVEGRTKNMKTFMNVFWWPLPGRREWWEKTQWFCENCEKKLATMKKGKEVRVEKEFAAAQ